MSKYLRSAFLLLIATLIAIFSLNGTAAAAPLSDAQREVLRKGILYYNTEEDSFTCVAGQASSANLAGGDNYEKAWNFFIENGYSQFFAAGVLGNFTQESGMNPRIVQGTAGRAPYEADAPVRGKGYGIAQWTTTGRQQGLETLAGSTGRSPGDLAVQLEYVIQELNGNTSFYHTEEIKAAGTASDAAYLFHKYYERSADTPDSPGMRTRINKANEYYTKFSGNAITSSTGPTATCGATTNGVAGNFIEYKQCNYGSSVPWADHPYGSRSNVCDAGCGPSAMAMIITNLTGQRVTPDMTADYGTANGTAANGGLDGSNWNIASVVGGHWGLTSEDLGTSADKIDATLRNGGMVLASGKGPNPFTSGGHFIVIRGLTDDGKWMTGNSAGYDSSQPYEKSVIMASLRHAWGLTKGQ